MRIRIIKQIHYLTLLTCMAIPLISTDSLAQAKLPELIPREVLFGNPIKQNPQLSYDGTHLSYLAPDNSGVMNIWARALKGDNDEIVSNDKHRGIRTYYWTKDSKRILYLQDQDGDENYHVYMVDLASKITRDLTPFQGIRAVNMIIGEKVLLVGLNIRNRQLYDVYRIDLETGAVILDTENPGDVIYMAGLEWIADRSYVIRAAKAMDLSDGSSVLKIRDGKSKPWRVIKKWPFGSPIGDGMIHSFSSDGQELVVFSSEGANTTGLIRVDANTGSEIAVIKRDDNADYWPEGILSHPITHKIQAIPYEYFKPEWEIIDEAITQDFEILSQKPGFFRILSRAKSDSLWIVSYEVDNGPISYYLYDCLTRTLEFLFCDRPELKKYVLAKMKPVLIEARDGLELVSYLTIPPGVQAKKLPMVLMVHGGPTARDSWGYNPEVQLLANRGYAVLQVNYRGSVGFGKALEMAGDGQIGVGSMQHDLTDAVRWAIKHGYADADRIAIYGGSYGGYATLAGLAFTPDLYACGVDICGPSNLKTMFEAFPPHWIPLKNLFKRKFGDPEGDENYNRMVSPLFHADQIRAPLMIGQGSNDPRVNIKESDQMVKALRERNLPVTYIVYPDEGHGFKRPENSMDFYGRMEEFLGKHLGGRFEPHRQIKGSSAEIR